MIRNYLAPERDAGAQEEAAALVMLAELLGGNGATSVLGRKLQFETQVAIYTSAFYRGTNYDDTSFGLVIVPVPGVSLQEAEDALDTAVAEFMAEGIDRGAVRADQVADAADRDLRRRIRSRVWPVAMARR